jgi:hypothetical protein
MARFLGSVLRYLGSGYRISGSEVRTDQLDLGGVQLVQDVSSLVSSGRGPGLYDGWFQGVAGVGIDAGSVATDEIVEMNPFRFPGGNITYWPEAGITDEYDLWLYKVWGSLDVIQAPENPTFAFLRVFMRTPLRYVTAFADPPGLSGSDEQTLLLASGTSVWPLDADVHPINLSSPVRTMDFNGPFLVPQGSRILVRGSGGSDGTGAGTAAVAKAICLFRAVPRGFPPGP